MDAIIGIIISVVMVALFAASAKKARKNGVPGDSAENFPFPDFDNEQEYFEDEEPVATGRTIAQMADDRMMRQKVDERITRSAPRSVPDPIVADEPIAVERREKGQKFDLEQAIVYSAILKPKYDDDIL